MKLKGIIIILFSLIYFGCANQLPPGGGEADTTPPEIVETYPRNGTINFEDDHLEVLFSEYVDKRTVKDAVFISPAVDGNPEFSWTNRNVTITFPFELKKNTTYIVNFGTDITDYNNHNKLKETYTLSFSTGDKIDRKEITGRVLDEEKQGIMIFVYKLDSLSNNLNPTCVKPDYISQTGAEGTFKVAGLPAGKFRIYAVKDEYRNLLFENDQDLIGMTTGDISISEEDTLAAGVEFYMTKVDSVKPSISSVTMTDNNHLVVTLSESIDSNYATKSNLYLMDSTTKVKLVPGAVYINPLKKTEVIVVTLDSLVFTNENFLIADTLKDLNGNYSYGEGITFTANSKPDTTKPYVLKSVPEDRFRKLEAGNAELLFYFNDAIDTNLVKQGIALTDTNKVVFPVIISSVSPSVIKVKAENKLKDGTDYIVKINHKAVRDFAGNYLDSVFVFRYRTSTILDYTGVTGKLGNVDLNKNPYLVLENIEDKEKFYIQKISNSEKFSFERIEPATYKLWLFYDMDKNGKLSKGQHFPFKPAESFYTYKEKLELRPRWVVTDVNFILK